MKYNSRFDWNDSSHSSSLASFSPKNLASRIAWTTVFGIPIRTVFSPFTICGIPASATSEAVRYAASWVTPVSATTQVIKSTSAISLATSKSS